MNNIIQFGALANVVTKTTRGGAHTVRLQRAAEFKVEYRAKYPHSSNKAAKAAYALYIRTQSKVNTSALAGILTQGKWGVTSSHINAAGDRLKVEFIDLGIHTAEVHDSIMRMSDEQKKQTLELLQGLVASSAEGKAAKIEAVPAMELTQVTAMNEFHDTHEDVTFDTGGLVEKAEKAAQSLKRLEGMLAELQP